MCMLVLCMILAVVWALDYDTTAQPVKLSYSEFLEWVEADLRKANGETLPEAQRDMSIQSVGAAAAGLLDR